MWGVVHGDKPQLPIVLAKFQFFTVLELHAFTEGAPLGTRTVKDTVPITLDAKRNLENSLQKPSLREC